MVKILIIEDDTDINNMIYEFLHQNGFQAIQAFSGTEGRLRLHMDGDYSLIIMDLMLPGISGEALLSELRRTSQIPVIILSAKNALTDKVELLAGGADDYLTKPFELEELLARIHVQLRHQSAVPSSRPLIYKRWKIDTDSRRLFVDDIPVELTAHEFAIIELLLRRPEKVFTKQEIYESIWEQEYAIEDKTINVHISNIRTKLKDSGTSEYIRTIWGIGFKIGH